MRKKRETKKQRELWFHKELRRYFYPKWSILFYNDKDKPFMYMSETAIKRNDNILTLKSKKYDYASVPDKAFNNLFGKFKIRYTPEYDDDRYIESDCIIDSICIGANPYPKVLEFSVVERFTILKDMD